MKSLILNIIIIVFIGSNCFCQNDIITTIWNAKSCGYQEICFPNFDTLQLSFVEEVRGDTLILNFIDRPKDTVKGVRDGIAFYVQSKEINLLQKNKTYLHSFTISHYEDFYFKELILEIEKERYFFKRELQTYQFYLYKKTDKNNKENNNCGRKGKGYKNKKINEWEKMFFNVL